MSEKMLEINQVNHGDSSIQIGRVTQVDQLVVQMPLSDGWDKLRGFMPDELINWARQQTWATPVSPWLFWFAYVLGFIGWSADEKKATSRVDWSTWAMAMILTSGALYWLFIFFLLLVHSSPTAKWAVLGMVSGLTTMGLMTAVEFFVFRPWRVANLVTSVNKMPSTV